MEDFPFLPSTKEDAMDHNEYLKECLETNKMSNGKKLDKKRKEWFKENIFKKNER